LVDPSEIVDNIVEKLRDITGLVTAVGGDKTKIFAYHDRYPENVSLEDAKYKLLHPGIMVAWQGTGLGSRGGFAAWRHSISIFLRATPEGAGGTPAGYYSLYRLIIDGVPTGEDGQALQYATIHSSCDPMDDVPPIQRQTDAAGVDYFEVTMSFTEK
jgi:hypothetical protein